MFVSGVVGQHCLCLCQGFEGRVVRLRNTLPAKHIELRAAVLQHLILVITLFCMSYMSKPMHNHHCRYYLDVCCELKRQVGQLHSLLGVISA